MTDPSPSKEFAFFDEGRGEPVILLHSSLSSSRQWRKLQQQIGHRYRLLGLDLLGYGDTSMPAETNDFSFDHEVDLVERLMDRVQTPVHLVGHSYGGSIALKTALRHPNRVRSIYAHEPVLLALLKSEGLLAEWKEISGVTLKATQHTREGRPDLAAEGFIDYWSGPGAWQKIPADRKAPITQMMPKLVLDFAAISRDSDPLPAYGNLAMPIQLTAGDTGAQTGRRVADLLERVQPGSLQIVEGAGHMAPLTDTDRINAIIARHLEAHSTHPRSG
jgi:pimeloyl-ACP methyl ester carboxylesterase